MSKANPFIPSSLDNPDLARDMRALANRLSTQAQRFEAENEHAMLACIQTAAGRFQDLARDLRIAAGDVQPEADPEPTAATAWVGGRVVTMRIRPDGTVTQADVDAFQRECAEAADTMRQGSHGTIRIVSTASGASDALGFPTKEPG